MLDFVYDRMGFDTVEDAVFQDLVIARIIEPTSKVDAIPVSTTSVLIRCRTEPFNVIWRRSSPTTTATGLPTAISDRVAITRLVKRLRPLRTATIAINGAVQDFPPQIPAR